MATSSSDAKNQPDIIPIGDKIPADLLNITLSSYDGQRSSLQQALDQCTDGVIICVYSNQSFEEFQDEENMFGGFPFYDRVITPGAFGLSSRPASSKSAVAKAFKTVNEDWEPVHTVYSDPQFRLLGPLGFIIPQSRRKQRGSVRCGSCLVEKDGTLRARLTGPLGNVLEATTQAFYRWRQERIRANGGFAVPW